MAIDVCTRINNYLSKLEQDNLYDEMFILGSSNIIEHMKNFDYNISKDSFAPIDKLNIKAFKGFDVLRATGSDCEIIIIVKDEKIIFKTKSLVRVPIYETICENIILSMEKKNLLNEVNVYFNNKHIINNNVIFNENKEIEAEKYCCQIGLISDLDIVYQDNLPSDIRFRNLDAPLLYKQDERDMLLEQLDDNIDTFLTELDKQLTDQKKYIKRG